jgi:hypothetical protein
MYLDQILIDLKKDKKNQHSEEEAFEKYVNNLINSRCKG